MQRIQTFRLLIVCAVVFLTACNQEKTRTVADYLHDIDAARAAKKFYGNDPGKYQASADWRNASEATTKVQFLNDCWPKKETDRFTTANTDHDCLNNKGFKR